MPLYEYECDACHHRFEAIRKFSDPPLEACPKCGSPIHKLVSAPAFHLKGSGWYITDYAKKDAGKNDKNEKNEKTDKAESGSTGEAKSTEGKASEGAGGAKTDGHSDSKAGAKSEAKTDASTKGKTETAPASNTAPKT